MFVLLRLRTERDDESCTTKLEWLSTSHWEHFMYPRSHGITDEKRRVTGVSMAGTEKGCSLLLQRDHRINTSENRL